VLPAEMIDKARNLASTGFLVSNFGAETETAGSAVTGSIAATALGASGRPAAFEAVAAPSTTKAINRIEASCLFA
jgi:hypothetical protein